MPRYFFDITDGGHRRDDAGTDCASDAAMGRVAQQTLLDIARDEIPGDGDRHFVTVVVRDEAQYVVYTATLGYAGMFLRDRPA